MEELQCKPFVYFLHRFRKRPAEKDLQTSDARSDCSRKIHRALLRLYRKGGVLPDNVFKLRLKGSGKCISRSGSGRLDNMFGPFGGFLRESLCWSLAHCPLNRRNRFLASCLSLLTPSPFCRIVRHQGWCFWFASVLGNHVSYSKPRFAFGRVQSCLDAIWCDFGKRVALHNSVMFAFGQVWRMLMNFLTIRGRNKVALCQLGSSWFSSPRRVQCKWDTRSWGGRTDKMDHERLEQPYTYR